MNEFNPAPEQVDGRSFDVVIIGGGISGASAAQHLAAAGYSVLLTEKNDFASAASGRSSRLLHNGLRYLAPPKTLTDFLRKPKAFLAGIDMARKSSKVGDEFVATTPERIRRTRLLIPLFETSPFKGWQIDLGAAFLKLVGRRQVPLNYRRTPAANAGGLPFVKWLRKDVGLRSVVEIDDHQFVAPERMCIDSILDARRMGAVTLNYVPAERIRRVGEGWEVGLRFSSGATATVTAKVLLNFAGVWIDRVNEIAAGNKSVSRRIVGVKGVSIAIQLPPECEGVGMAGTNAEGDAVMCVPWGKLHYLGPTETVYDGDIETIQPEASDIDHLLHDVDELLPGLGVKRSDILYSWAGLRPITYDPDRPKGRRMPFNVLHRLDREGLPNFFNMTWAAIMFHRPAARGVVAEVGRSIAPSGAPQPMQLMPESARDAPPPFIETVPGITRDALVRCVTEEGARDLVGILFRRTGLGWITSLPPGKVREAALLVAPHLGWDAREIDAQVAAFEEYMRTQHMPGGQAWVA